MRTTQLLAVLVVLSISATASVAHADIDGVYEVKYEELSTNCTNARLVYAPGTLTVKIKGSQLLVDIDRTPVMIGALAKNGKVSAKSKPGNTMIQGMQGVFSVAGRITPEGLMYVVLVGEYSANGKSLCTQSWNVSGPKVTAKQ